MKKRAAVGLVAVGLLGGVMPQAEAAPVLRGSTSTTSGVRFGCEGAYCTSFRMSECPTEMAKADGVTTSIVDVSGLGNRLLTFTWSDATMTAASGAVLYFYAVASCPPYGPQEFPNALHPVITLNASSRSAAYRIPVGTKWLIAEAAYHSTAATWSAS